MFVNVELFVPMPAGITVPADAILDSGLSKRVFVQSSAGHFEARKVETGWRHNNRVQIVKGLREGETVVVAGTFLVDSESRLEDVAKISSSPRDDSRTETAMDHSMN
jgi:multidrug efflux pump subunit AcrA (membrane-fusion protein)